MGISQTHPQPGSSLPEPIGSTPLVRLNHLVQPVQPVRGLHGITLLAKAEWANPGGSVMDRAAAGRRAVIVTVLPDSAEKYLSERFWEEA
jgi:cysteine synthase